MNNTIRSFYDLSATDINKRMIKFERFRDRICIIVNLESTDGLSLKTLRLLSEFKDGDRGNLYEILIFPCKQYLPAAFHKTDKIKTFVTDISNKFIIFDYVNVSAVGTQSPVYSFLFHNYISWNSGALRANFTKFVVDKDGVVIHKYEPNEYPSHYDHVLIKFEKPKEEISFNAEAAVPSSDDGFY